MAHIIEDTERTEDIQITEDVEFEGMLLSDNILKGLKKNGFKKPSPIQLKAIPLGRCGFDLIIQAKSGTGKTAVFGITALEMINLEKPSVQAIILAPTREIAVQIKEVISSIGCELNGLRVEYFIGGIPINEDEIKVQTCHIAVGAPGRIRHLIEKNILKISNVRLFVLDEADKLLENQSKDVNWIYNNLKGRKQIIAASATYPDELKKLLANYMTSPTHVCPNTKMPILLGLRQFYIIVKSHLNVLQQMKFKTEILTQKILSNISFGQCLIFSNYQTRAESLSNNLSQIGWPSTFISGLQDQSTRLQAVDDLKKFKCRILSSTDLTARGIDAANVDLVINYDVPYDTETYLHRMGRAGRYGSYGICITILAEGKDVCRFKNIISKLGQNYSVSKLPEDENLKNIWTCDIKSLEQMYGENESKIEIDQDDKQENDPESKMDDKAVIEKACEQLTSLLNKPLDSGFEDMCVIENMESVSYILQNIDKYDVDSQTDSKIDKQENKPIEQISKKQKLNKPQNIITETNTTFKIASQTYQDNEIYKKNVSLFDLTQYLNAPTENLNEKYINGVENILDIIKNEEEQEVKAFDLNSLSTLLQEKNIVNKKNKGEKKEERRIEKFCSCDEQLFTVAFNYSVSEKEDWRNAICDKHKIKTQFEETMEQEDTNEGQEMENREEWYEEYTEQEGNSYEEYNEDHTHNGIIEENTFTQAYDRAVNDEDTNHINSSYPNKRFINFAPHEIKKLKRKLPARMENKPYLSPELENFVSRRNSYINYFQHYSDALAEAVPRCHDVGEFRNYFDKWKQGLEAVRDFVQQDVYMHECHK